MLNIVGEMMSKPEMAHDIMLDVNKGDYMSVTNSLILALNDPSFKLKDTLAQQSKDGLFDNLFKGVVDVDAKDSGVIKQQLENYGLQAEDVVKLSKVMPLLLDKPESLQKVFSSFVKGDYTGIAKELITLTKDNPEIQQYLNDNKRIFAKVGVKVGLDYVTQAVTNIFSGTPQPVEDKITDKNILIDQAVDKIFLQAKSESKQNLPNKKEFANEVKTLCKENPELENYIVEKLSSKPISSVGDVSTPKTNQYRHVSDHANSPMQVAESFI